MTETQLAELVAQGDSDTLEFKKTTAEKEAAMKTLCGLLNGNGGFCSFCGTANPSGPKKVGFR
ncbi:MAG: hypothetical protein J5I93_27890 [Pirellulaceae bacterium]|nr:hypothetical protein [Pirellulaceae bacterium]